MVCAPDERIKFALVPASGMVYTREEDGATAFRVVVLVIPNVIWFVVLVKVKFINASPGKMGVSVNVFMPLMV